GLPHRFDGRVQHARDGMLVVARVEVEQPALAPDLEDGVSRHHQRDAEHESDRELAGELHPDWMWRSCCTRGRLCLSAAPWRRTALAGRSGAAVAGVLQRS